MANGPLSSVMIIAGAGLIANPSTTLIANTDLSNVISTYQSYVQVGNVVSAALNVNVTANATIISDTTFSSLVSMGNSSVPALGDAVVSNLAILTSSINDATGNVTLVADGINNTASFTQVVQDRGNQILGNGDLSIFSQVYSMSEGYLTQTNTYINSTENTNIIATTFTGMDALTTGSISLISSNVSALGSDLSNLGTTIDLSRLQYLGRPWLLLRQMLEAGGLLPGIYNALNLAGVSDIEIRRVQDNQPEISADLDKKIYNAFLLTTGDDLRQICELLDVTIPVSTVYKNQEYNFRRLDLARSSTSRRGEITLVNTGTGVYEDLQAGSATGVIGETQVDGTGYSNFRRSPRKSSDYATFVGGEIQRVNSIRSANMSYVEVDPAAGLVEFTETEDIETGRLRSTEYSSRRSAIKSEVRRINFDRLLNAPVEITGKLETAADLLNPLKILPQSWPSLIVQLPSCDMVNSIDVYNNTGSVNNQVTQFYQADPAWTDLSKVIPPDQAAANLAFARSLRQVKNISNLTLPELAASVTAIETNQGLNDINSLDGSTGPVPDNVKNEIYSELGTGSGNNGALLLEDFMGTINGVPWTGYIGNVNNELANISSLSDFANITGTYTVMIDMLNGAYGNVEVGNIFLPGDLTPYPNADAALQPLIANAVANISTFQFSYPVRSIALNDLWINLGNRLIMENNNLQLAGVDFDELQTNRSSIMSLGTSLHSIGIDPTTAVFFESIANTQNQSGQAVIASMREGRNIDALGKSGVGTDTQLPAD